MTFTTPTFLIFLVVVYLLYWELPQRFQNYVILVASLVFYGWWDWRFLVLMMAVAFVDYLVALGLSITVKPGTRRLLLGISLLSNLGILGFFKYFKFFTASFHDAMSAMGLEMDPVLLEIILPVGISFYTFQALSYTIDVYRGVLPAVRNFTSYLCFITFFPHMVAGPIQQAKHLLVQFEKSRSFDWGHSVDGLRQMLWGFFKKMVIADNLAPLVNAAYGNVEAASGWELLWATYYFAFQIYCDFSGYTDIAIGCARLFDLHMTTNFRYPYLAVNIKDFWQRWHISLSNWFREYVYIPLGGNRRGTLRTYVNIFIVFVLSGVWHWANWTFLVWGVLHGTYYCIYGLWAGGLTGPTKTDDQSWLHWKSLAAGVVTFHLVLVAWVFFRAADVGVALTVIGKICAAPATEAFVRPAMRLTCLMGLLLLFEWAQRRQPHAMQVQWWWRSARWVFYYGLVGAILLACQLNYTPFIYFQF